MVEHTEVTKSVNDYINDVQQHVQISKVEVNSFLFSLARKYKDICIEPIGFDESKLHEKNPFVKEILSTGKELPIQW